MAGIAATPSPSTSGAPRLAASAVLAAASAVRADPDFGGTRTERQWRLKPTPDDGESAPVPDWLRALGAWLAEGGRGLAWLALAAAVAALAVGARHWLRLRGDAVAPARRRLPTHVGALDIRPESLPDDVAGAADALWRRGDARGALALLYRGALSRLVHAHGLAVEASTTEREVMRLARAGLDADAAGYVDALVGAWSLASWGGRPVEGGAFAALRDGLDCLRPRPAADAAGAAAPRAGLAGAVR